MAGLVPEMAEHSAVRFVHRHADLLTRRIVRLGCTDRDEAVFVAGQCGLYRSVGLDLVNEKIENETACRILIAVDARQVPFQHGIKEVTLSLADAPPLPQSLLGGGIRYQTVMAADRAKGIGIVRENGPVADIHAGIGAKPDLPLRVGE
ncbi:hypothetical protein D3C87_1600610 [compost metagenome]